MACEFCLNERGGTEGNENVVQGVVACDDCSVLLAKVVWSVRKECGVIVDESEFASRIARLSALAKQIDTYHYMSAQHQDGWTAGPTLGSDSDDIRAIVSDAKAIRSELLALELYRKHFRQLAEWMGDFDGPVWKSGHDLSDRVIKRCDRAEAEADSLDDKLVAVRRLSHLLRDILAR